MQETKDGKVSYVHRGQVEDAAGVAAQNGLEMEEAKCRWDIQCPPVYLTISAAGIRGISSRSGHNGPLVTIQQ